MLLQIKQLPFTKFINTMKSTSNNIKTYLKFSCRVLGISNIYARPATDVTAPVAEIKKASQFYFWPDVNAVSFNKQLFEHSAIHTVFVFFTTQNQFENRLHSHVEMISKMHGVLGGIDGELLVGWATPNSEIDFFSVVAQQIKPLRIVFFRDTSKEKTPARDSIYLSGVHTILETLSPLENPNDMDRKRLVWNDFKRMLAFSTRPIKST